MYIIHWFEVWLLVCSIVGVKSSDLEFTTSTTTLQMPIARNLTMRCSLKDSAAPSQGIVGRRDVTHTAVDVMYVTSMVVTKDGSDVASISEHIPASAFDKNSTVQVTGRISSNDVEKGFIELQWLYPESEEAGTYICSVVGVDKQGHGFSYSKTLVIEETVADLASQVASMKHFMDLMRNQISRLQTVLYSGAPCISSSQCAGDLQCLGQSDTCGCPAHHYLVDHDACAPGLGAFCNSTDMCAGWDMRCSDNKCTCPSGFFPGMNTCLRTLGHYSYKYLAFDSPGVVTTLDWPFQTPSSYQGYTIDFAIYADNGNHVHLTFTDVDLDAGSRSQYMYIDVFDDSDANDSRKIARITHGSDSWIGKVFKSSGNVLAIRYNHGTDNNNGSGFRATFNRVV